jgi:hypothetical protein
MANYYLQALVSSSTFRVALLVAGVALMLAGCSSYEV